MKIASLLIVSSVTFSVGGCVRPCDECGDSSDDVGDIATSSGGAALDGIGGTGGGGTGGGGTGGGGTSTGTGGAATAIGGTGGTSTGGASTSGTGGASTSGTGGTSTGTTATGGTGNASTGGAGGASTSATGGATTGGTGGTTDPPDGEWVDVTSNLAGVSSECGTVVVVEAKPNEDVLLVGIARQGIWQSQDGGETWTQLEGSPEMDHRPTDFLFDPDNPLVYWVSGIYGPGVFETANSGADFVRKGEITHVDLVSVDFTDPERKVILAGGHEQPEVLYRSMDGGATFEDIGMNLPTEGVCTTPLVIDADVHLLGCMQYFDGPWGILRSEDGGDTWNRVSEHGGGWARPPLWASDGTIYWMNHDWVGLARSFDLGETWEQVNEFDVRSQPLELPDGRLAAMSTTRIIVSADKGETWVPVTTDWPADDSIRGPAYSVHQKAFFIWDAECGGGEVPVAEGSIHRYDWDYETE